jgi:hypothetical protein
MRRKQLKLRLNDCILHFDNATAQNARSVKQFLAQKKLITEMGHAPFASDFAPNDSCFFFLQKLSLF